ncbi:MAG: uracil-DNA glycosylase family protein [Gammaproteobacteria bacterium]|nr:uracil-DNA glycosylase family protein [Gammaproteobacteria bacterium]
MSDNALTALLKQIRACKICAEELAHEPRPIVQGSTQATIAIIGQAPGLAVHRSGVPWDDPSGDRLRHWLGLDRATFYGPQVALIPMGFCYPGRGKSGDLPPDPRCAPHWHAQLLGLLPRVGVTLLVGAYAQKYYLDVGRQSLTEIVRDYTAYQPQFFPLPHPSPRNNIWLSKNPWFEQKVIPALRRRMHQSGL